MVVVLKNIVAWRWQLAATKDVEGWGCDQRVRRWPRRIGRLDNSGVEGESDSCGLEGLGHIFAAKVWVQRENCVLINCSFFFFWFDGICV